MGILALLRFWVCGIRKVLIGTIFHASLSIICTVSLAKWSLQLVHIPLIHHDLPFPHRTSSQQLWSRDQWFDRDVWIGCPTVVFVFSPKAAFADQWAFAWGEDYLTLTVDRTDVPVRCYCYHGISQSFSDADPLSGSVLHQWDSLIV